jgi:sortase A
MSRRLGRRATIGGLIALAGAALLVQGLLIPAKAAVAQALLERAFERTLATGETVKAWPWADTAPIGVVEVPRLRARAIVLDGASGEALAFGPAHLNGTPWAGDEGTAVIAAHRDTHFAFLREVRTGDRIEVTARDGRRLAFRVTETYVARWDTSGIDGQATGARLALVTCWPFEGVSRGPLRFIVLAEREPTAGTPA